MRTVGIGRQDFEKIRVHHNFYVDKTDLIRQWWEADDDVTLVTRPRRFGKTLNMSMLEKFFSLEYAGRSELFEGLSIWQEEKYRRLQGTYPVLFMSFANVKETDFASARRKICQLIADVYARYSFLLEEGGLVGAERETFLRKNVNMDDVDATLALGQLSHYLSRYYGRNVILLLDEYDTPMQEAYVNGYWEELISFIRNLFNATFKTNPCFERAFMTGIARVSKESFFSDLNNLEVITTTSDKYADCFGFTEEEVYAALEEYGLSDYRQQVKDWYDGFSFGERKDIYNPWSIINFLDKRKAGTYWVNTSSNDLLSKLVREGSRNMKSTFEKLIQGESFRTELDEQIVYELIDRNEQAVWSLLLASGCLKVKRYNEYMSQLGEWKQEYELELTNFEVKTMFRGMIRKWFHDVRSDYNDFIKALLSDDVRMMNTYMNKITLEMFSYFDTGKRASGAEPERFYHGFVLGLMVDLADRYMITSNRESGFGRYDIMLEPRTGQPCTYDAVIIEFKVQAEEEKELSDTVQEALRQIRERNYNAELTAKGIPEAKIRNYGFAFCGKQVLIGGGKIL